MFENGEKGIVKFFNGAENKRFGFIVPEGKQPGEDDVFFHYNGFRKFEANGNEVVFSNTGYNHPAAFPKKGDVVLYKSRQSPKGLVAEPWGYKHDYERMKSEMRDKPNYGDSFIYISLCEGNLPEMRLQQLGTFVGVPEEQREKYLDMMYDRGFSGRVRLTRVIPHPGMEKKIGRAFRELSYDEGRWGMDKSIEVVEIPQEHVYTGVVEREFLRSSRSLSLGETQNLIAMGKPAFAYSEYWHCWSRILGYYEGGFTREVMVALTCPHGWDVVKSVSIYVGSPGHSAEKNEGPFPIFPDTVREDMEEAIGVDLTRELLTKNYFRQFSPSQIIKADRNHTGGGWLNLAEITSTNPFI